MAERKPPEKSSESDASVEMNKKLPGTDNPPAVQMAAPAHAGVKMDAAPVKVRIKALRDIDIGGRGEDGKHHQKVLRPGDEADVTPEQAVEFCDKGFKGLYPYSGERYEDKSPAVIKRAVRV